MLFRKEETMMTDTDNAPAGSQWRRLEGRQWWLWFSAITVTLLLTLGIVSFVGLILSSRLDAFYGRNLELSVRGLVGLVLLFDVFVLYQQFQIHLIRHKLIERENLFRLIGENAADMIAVVSRDGRRLYNSPAYQQILGYSEEELAATPAFEQVHPDDRAEVMKAAEEAAHTGVGRRLDYRMRCKDGTWRVLESTASVVPGGASGGPHIVIVNRDVTDRKRMEEQLRQSQKMEAVGRLAGGVAHDFNNLLAVILGHSELLAETTAPEQVHKRGEQIKKAAEDAANLTRQLLSFSRKQVLAPTVLDVGAVVSEMEDMLHRLLGEDIELCTVFDPEPALVRADRGQLQQVIMNLAANARDAMPEGGSLSIESARVQRDEGFARQHSPLQPGTYLLLIVSDTGKGMDAETKAHIFEPFFTTKALGKGTGLGLATVYGIVRQSGGHICVNSEPGRGTTFEIYLPCCEEAAVVQNPRPASESLCGWETVLVVEDAEPLRALATEILARNGYGVLQAGTGAEAIRLAEQYPGAIDLLLTDVVLPGMDGRQLAESLAASRPGLKVLYVSGYADQTLASHGVLIPGTRLLHKPFRGEALVRQVREVLDVVPAA
jgi:two-component system cell cycle sensor histidine kinase/response regulator CckA